MTMFLSEQLEEIRLEHELLTDHMTTEEVIGCLALMDMKKRFVAKVHDSTGTVTISLVLSDEAATVAALHVFNRQTVELPAKVKRLNNHRRKMNRLLIHKEGIK
jgi:hypothetical protein